MIVNLIKNSCNGTSGKVLHAGQLSQSFNVKTCKKGMSTLILLFFHTIKGHSQREKKWDSVNYVGAPNIAKTQVMKIHWKTNNPNPMYSTALVEVEAFAYLGSDGNNTQMVT